MNNKGFTLVEVLAVIAIIAIVGTVAVPGVLSMIGTSKDRSYEIMIDNIRVAAEEMYQEIDYFGSINSVGNKTSGGIMVYNICTEEGNCKSLEEVKIEANGIMKVNLQSLVGNGFLNGENNDNSSNNKNRKIITNPKNGNDIGSCLISVTKVRDENTKKICYKILGSSEDGCPITLDFGGDSQCTS